MSRDRFIGDPAALQPVEPRKVAQTVVSLCVLAVLAGVAAGLLIKQARFGRDGDEPAEDGLSFEHLLPAELVPMSPPERFTPATLWEKINGQADFYVDAGLVQLTCQRFALAASPADWLELYVYDMAEHAGALAVFVPREGATTIDLTDRAYESGGSVFFTHGRYYVEVKPSAASPQLAEAAMALATSFVAETAIDTAVQLDPAELFPPDGLVPDSIQFKKSNVFGFAGLDNVHTASYTHAFISEDLRVTAYVSPRASAAEAKRLAEAYEQFLRELGAGDVMAFGEMLPGKTVLRLFDRYYVVFHRGRFMAGVNDCEARTAAQVRARLLYDHLSELAE